MPQIVTSVVPLVNGRPRAHGVALHCTVRPRARVTMLVGANHSPKFLVDGRAFPTGVRILTHLAADYLQTGRAGSAATGAP